MAPDPINSSADSEDEDLFDFPSVLQAASGANLGTTTSSTKAAPAAATSQATEDSVSDEDILSADDLLETLDDIDAMAMEGELPDFDTLTAETPIMGKEAAAADSVPAPLPSAQISLDGDLDEDIFGFDGNDIRQLSADLDAAPAFGNSQDDDFDLDDDGEDVPTLNMDVLLNESGPELAPLAGPSSADIASDDLILEKTVKTPARPAPKTSAPLVERQVAPEKANPGAVPEPGPVRGLDMPAPPQFENLPVTNTVMAPAGADDARRGHLIEILAIGFLVINTGLVLLAWRAGDQFQETLLTVARTVGGAVNQQPAMAGNNTIPIQIMQPPVIQDTEQDSAEDTIEQPVVQPQPLKQEVRVDIDGLTRMVLDDAITQMENGKHEAARTILYHMISNRDRVTLPDAIVDEAEILIARSYQLQGAALKAAQQ
ncbi:MAG: hypothetical protein ACI8QC_000820 [Planctomycetota bacterium]|jgi:hypothetical protein